MQRAILSMTLALAFGQATSESYAGTWTAELAGQTYVRIELQVTNGTLGGRISLGNIEVDSRVRSRLPSPHRTSSRLSSTSCSAIRCSRSRGRTATTPTISS